jgi:glucose/arabinose dehydrogenase
MRATLALALAALPLLALLPPALGGAEVQATRVPLSFGAPAALAALPDGSVLVGNLANGHVHRVSPQGQVSAAVIDLPSSPPNGEYGLLGLAAHPAYPSEPWVYAFYTEMPAAPSVRFQRIVRFELLPGAAQAGAVQDVVTGLTTGAACCHNGGRIAFGPDGMLYATVGDNMVSALAQVPNVVAGKVLRYTPTGAIPHDNPVPGSPVAVTGMRNTFGLTFDAQWGMVATDNGPSGFDGIEGADEVNLLEVGDNGGWPLSRGSICLPTHTCPVWQSGNAHLGPTGVEVPRGSLVPAWDGKVLWCNVNDGRGRLLDPAVPNPQPTVAIADGCRYDVVQDALGRIVTAGDGELWVHG